MVPNGWEQKSFKDILKLDRGSSPRPIVNFMTDSDDGVNWIKIGDTKGEAAFINSTKEKITKEGAKKSREVSKGEIILSNSMSYGKPYILNIDGYIHDGWFVIRNYEQNLDKGYLIQLLGGEIVQRQYKRLAAGGVVTNISSELVYFVKVNLPPLPEQRKIAKILSTWDKAISTTERLIDNSKQQKKALMQQLLTGKKRLLDDSGKPFEGEWLFSTFSEVFKVANNKKTQIKSGDYLESGNIPIVDQGKQLISGYTNNVEKYDDIPVIIFGDHTRIVKWVDFEFAQGADGTQVLKATKRFDTKFSYYLLSNTDIPNLGYSRHMRELKEKDFKHPNSIKEQQKIALVLTNADNEIGLLEQQLADLKQEKKALMQQLLTGKRRVKVDDKEVA